MKAHKFLVCLFLVLALGCDVDRVPETQLSDVSFWQSEGDLQAAANYFYTFLPTMPINEDNMSADVFGASTNEVSDGSRLAPSTSGYYSGPYELIRATNNLIEKAPRVLSMNIPEAAVNRYIAEARFFRAWAHFLLVEKYGDVPLITKTLADDDPQLTSTQNPREDVLGQIYKDLDFAAENLPTPENLGTAGYGRVSNTAALALKARAALFEGTRSKFHKYGDYKKHLAVAVAAAKRVMDSKQHSLFPDYYKLFQYDGEGRKNPENIFVRQYGVSLDVNIMAHNGPRAIAQGNGNPTKVLIDSYLMKDGLPITKSPLYKEPKNTLDVFRNRDERLGATVMKKGDPYGVSGTSTLLYNIPFTTTGFCFRKFVVIQDMFNNTASFIDLPLIRYAEILLIYAEAVYELNGSISDSELDNSINLLRQRGSVVPLSNKLVQTYGLDMREELRRERRVELSMEGFRYWDLLRWKTAENELVKPVLGSKYFINEFLPVGGVVGQKLTADSLYLVQDASQRRFDPGKDYLWPFPVNELALNPNLKQNPGW